MVLMILEHLEFMAIPQLLTENFLLGYGRQKLILGGMVLYGGRGFGNGAYRLRKSDSSSNRSVVYLGSKKYSNTMTRIELTKKIIRYNIKRHRFAQALLMFVMFLPIGIGVYYFLVHHDFFYGKPEYLVPLVAGVLVYITIMRKLSQFLIWIIFNEVV